METVLAGLHWQICLIYLDDIIVTGRTFESMVENVGRVLDRFRDAGLKLKARKCCLFARKVEFLGHIVSSEGIRTDPKKTESIKNWPTPKCTRDVRSFLGLCSYYRRFIFQFAETAKPLHRLSEKNQKFIWTQDCSKAFETLKKKLTEAPILAHPDFNEKFILDTDASDMAIAAILSQKLNGQEHVIAYASRTLSRSERRYCVTRKELLAVVHFIKHFRHYLYGKQFLLRTDHGSLRWIMNFKNPEGQVARWLEILPSYDMKIEYRAGRLHKNADGLRRQMCKQCGLDCSVPDKAPKNLVAHIDSLRQEDNTNTDSFDLVAEQAEDDDIKTVKEWILQGSRPDSKAIQERSYYLKSLWSQWERLKIKNNLLVRRWDILETGQAVWQAVIPLRQRRTVLRFSHDIKASGHLGIKKTLGRIRQRFYWPGLQNDVKMYVNGCEICAKRKGPSRTKKAPMQITRSGYPLERIAVDILGELPQTESGNKNILVISDYFTKWTESFPMSNMEASTVASIMIKEFISRFGIPKTIHSDQGSQFVSKLFLEMCRLLQIEKTRTTPYHPESDGMVERFNRTLCTMLSAFVDENHKNWDSLLPFVMMAYRAAEHETTGVSPNVMMLGRETTTPLEILYEMPPRIKSVPVNQWVWELQEAMESAHKYVRTYTGKSILRQKKLHDTSLSYETFEKGDQVYVFFPVKKVGCSSKFASYWRGPFEVKDKLSDVLYKVDCGRSGSVQVIHTDRMRKIKSQVLRGENLYLPVQTGSSDEANFKNSDIEKIGEGKQEEDEVQYSARGRKVRKPEWLKEYVFSICRCKMAKTKQTPRTRPATPATKVICPVHKDYIPDGETFEEHVLGCAKENSAKMVKCDVCDRTFKKDAYRRRHMKNEHGAGKDSVIEISTDHDQEQDRESEWDSDPEVEVFEESHDSFIDPCVRKRTNPSPVMAPVKERKELKDSDKTETREQIVNKIGGDKTEFSKTGLSVQEKQTPGKEAETKSKNKETEWKNVQTDVETVENGAQVSIGTVEKEMQTDDVQTEGACKAQEEKNHCRHCDIYFGDKVMFYVHQGIHAVGHPLKCNICGVVCEDKINFHTHITWGHMK